MRRNLILGILVVFVAISIGGGGYYWQQKRQGDKLLFEAQEALEEQDWPGARINAKRLLRRSQHANDARMILAEATIRDEGIERQKAVDDALSFLEAVEGEQAIKARVRQAELRLLILKQPKHAERIVLDAIESDPDNYEAHFLLWTILTGTGRSHLSHDLFWKIVEIAPDDVMFVALRQWFLCEFATSNFNMNLDRAIGVLGATEMPILRTSFDRLLMFRNSEPNEPDNVAALANWFEAQADAEQSFNLLQEASSKKGVWDSEQFVSVLVRTCIELGAFDEAKSYFDRWPDPKDGYLYWRTRGIIEQVVVREYESAIESYKRAALLWPGDADWSLYFRMATCAELLGRTEDAERFRKRGDEIVETTDNEILNDLLVVLANGETDETIDAMIEFYRSLDRDGEVEAWETLRK